MKAEASTCGASGSGANGANGSTRKPSVKTVASTRKANGTRKARKRQRKQYGSCSSYTMPEKQRNGACSRGSRDPEAVADFSVNGACCGGSRDPETGSSCSELQRNGACSRACRDPEAEPSCQRKGACSEGCRDPEAESRRLVAPTQGVANLQAVGVGGPSSGDQRTSVPSDARCGLSATADGGNREAAICILEVRNADGDGRWW